MPYVFTSLFPAFLAGVCVSRGTGTFGPPLRVGTHSEMTVITLMPANGSGGRDGTYRKKG